MSFLTEKPPENLEVNGEKYPINTDFRTVLRYMEVVEDADETLADIERCLQISFTFRTSHHFHDIDYFFQISQVCLVRFYFRTIDTLQ